MKALFENLEAGARLDEFLEWFPGVSKEQVEAVLQHAELSPRRSLSRTVRTILRPGHTGPTASGARGPLGRHRPREGLGRAHEWRAARCRGGSFDGCNDGPELALLSRTFQAAARHPRSTDNQLAAAPCRSDRHRRGGSAPRRATGVVLPRLRVAGTLLPTAATASGRTRPYRRTGPEVAVEPVDALPDELLPGHGAAGLCRPRAACSSSAVPRSWRKARCDDSSGKKWSYRPFSISVGVFTRVMKLMASASGSAVWNASPPDSSTAARFCLAFRTGHLWRPGDGSTVAISPTGGAWRWW